MLPAILIGPPGLGGSTSYVASSEGDSAASIEEQPEEAFTGNRREWTTFVQIQSWHVQLEKEGEPAPALLESWEIFWNRIFQALYDSQGDNPEIWIEKVLELRRDAALPDIEVTARP